MSQTESCKPGRTSSGRTSYIHHPDEYGRLVGMVDTPALATKICDAMSACSPAAPPPSHPAVPRHGLADMNPQPQDDGARLGLQPPPFCAPEVHMTTTTEQAPVPP